MTVTTSAAAGDPLRAPKAAALAKARLYPRGKQSPLCDGCLSVIEFCGNELKICGNTNGLCPVHCVKRWPRLAQRIARALDLQWVFSSSTDETVPVCATVPSCLAGTRASCVAGSPGRPENGGRNAIVRKPVSRFAVLPVPLTSKAADARRCLRSIGAGAARLPIGINPEGATRHALTPASAQKIQSKAPRLRDRSLQF